MAAPGRGVSVDGRPEGRSPPRLVPDGRGPRRLPGFSPSRRLAARSDLVERAGDPPFASRWLQDGHLLQMALASGSRRSDDLPQSVEAIGRARHRAVVRRLLLLT